MRLCLRPLMNTSTLPDIRLSSGETKTLGRAITADVVIDEPSLSRLHARLSVDENGRLTVQDLGSTSGIFINGEPQQSGPLAAGDHVRFGFLEYLVDAERPTQFVRADHTILRMPVPDHAKAVEWGEAVLAVDPEDVRAHYTLMLASRGLGDEAAAKEHEIRYLRFKADEDAQVITGEYRRTHPEDNNERQPIHEHVSVALDTLSGAAASAEKAGQ